MAFGQVPDAVTITGALLIIVGTLLASYNKPSSEQEV
jgi:drug/metabolite transporter (DMT)-like permease